MRQEYANQAYKCIHICSICPNSVVTEYWCLLWYGIQQPLRPSCALLFNRLHISARTPTLPRAICWYREKQLWRQNDVGNPKRHKSVAEKKIQYLSSETLSVKTNGFHRINYIHFFLLIPKYVLYTGIKGKTLLTLWRVSPFKKMTFMNCCIFSDYYFLDILCCMCFYMLHALTANGVYVTVWLYACVTSI